MKEMYNKPELEIIMFETADIITTSNTIDRDFNDTPEQEI